MNRNFTEPPSLAEIEAIALEAQENLPEPLRSLSQGVILHVDDFPAEEVMAEMELETPFDLLGLYVGIDLSQKSVFHQPEDIDRIYLYRRPLLNYWCESGEDLAHLIRHVMIHEIGHHFGLSDEAMERIEEGA